MRFKSKFLALYTDLINDGRQLVDNEIIEVNLVTAILFCKNNIRANIVLRDKVWEKMLHKDTGNCW